MKEVKHDSRVERIKFNRKQKLVTLAVFTYICVCISQALHAPLLYNVPLNELILSTPIHYDYLPLAIWGVAFAITMLSLLALLLGLWLVGRYTSLFNHLLEIDHTYVSIKLV